MKSTLLASVVASIALGTGLVHVPAQADTMKPTSSAKNASEAGTWVTARQKHNGSGLLLRYQRPADVKAGASARVTLTLAGVTAPEGAQVELKGSDPAMTVLLNGKPLSGAVALSAGEMRRMDLEVINAPEGQHTLNVYLSQGGRHSVQSIPFSVGQGQMSQKPQGQAQTTPSGERVMVLPAQTK